MRWLIVEDALRDRKGHWFEWVKTFYEGFRELGDQVTVLADASVLPEIRDPLNAEPILPNSIWHRMGDGAGALRRYSRVFAHGLQTWRVMRQYLSCHHGIDAIFVPTVLPHHLVAWAPLIRTTLRKRRTRVLLFFLTGPLVVDSVGGNISLDHSPSAKLLIRLLKWIEPEIRNGQVVLGVETEQMRHAMQTFLGLPFTCFPQPVKSLSKSSPGTPDRRRIEMACFGAARAEKGSDVLQDAILMHRQRSPSSQAAFTIQWIDDFSTGGGRVQTKRHDLLTDERVKFVTRYFVNGEYAEHLLRTQVLLLPYRLSSYRLRGSRVVIEAAVNGLPVIVTGGTTLADVASNFGAGLHCQDGDPGSLARAIAEMETRFDELSAMAREKQRQAARFFSVESFRDIFMGTVRSVGLAA
jgi:glycosyltransferase involved in cell wall biosynthesis